jgi:Zn2+/Cd2+-exporting ATPase
VQDGAIVVRTSAAAANSTAARIARVTAEALTQRAQVETALSQLTNHWSKVVIIGTACAFMGLLACGVPVWGSQGAAYRALGVLTAAAPCGLLLAPLAFVCAVAVLSRHGIIVKGAHLFDSLARISFVALDKTGTISQGELTCTSVQGVWGRESSRLKPLVAAAALSFRGKHPVCAAVLSQFAKSKNLQVSKLFWKQSSSAGGNDGKPVPEVTDFASRAGAGMSGIMGDTAAAFGSVEYIQPLLTKQQQQTLAVAVQRQGSNTVNSVLIQGPVPSNTSDSRAREHFGPASAEQITLFTFADVPKEDSRMGISDLRDIGLDLAIYTGDNQSSALAMAERIGVPPEKVFAGLAPEKKAALVTKLQESGECVLMVGDGINDAPALATADVSVALAECMESATAGVANVVLLHSQGGKDGSRMSSASIRRIAFLLQIAYSVRDIVIQNLTIAFCSMFAGALPALGGLVPLWVAVLIHEGSTVLVALNSCRLLLMRQAAVVTG